MSTKHMPRFDHEETQVETYKKVIFFILLGIVFFSVAFFFLRQQPKSFTELAFSNNSALPDFITPGRSVSFNIILNNQENKDMDYTLNLTASEDSVDRLLYTNTFSIPKNEKQEITLNFTVDDFKRTDIITSVANSGKDLHFYLYNSDYFMKYPDGVASIQCVNSVSVAPQESLVIRVKGRDSPIMKVRIDGKQVFSKIITNTSYENIVLKTPAQWSYLDIIFDNDLYNVTRNIDRNLYVEYVQIGNTKLTIRNMTIDGGKGITAFDCNELKTNATYLTSNSAMRVRLDT